MKANNTIVTNYINAVEFHINAGTKLKQAMKELTPIYNKASVSEQHVIRNNVAKLIGKKLNVTPRVLEQGIYKGTLGFASRESKEENNARSMLGYYLPTTSVQKTRTPTTTRQSVDPVQTLLTKFKTLTKAEQRRFLTAIAK